MNIPLGNDILRSHRLGKEIDRVVPPFARRIWADDFEKEGLFSCYFIRIWYTWRVVSLNRFH